MITWACLVKSKSPAVTCSHELERGQSLHVILHAGASRKSQYLLVEPPLDENQVNVLSLLCCLQDY